MEDDRYLASYDGLKVEARIVGKEIEINTTSTANKANRSIKAYNKFLEAATGYMAKERRADLRKGK